MPGLDHALRQAELAVITGRRAKPGSKSPMLHQKIKDGICHPLFFDETSTIRTPSSPAKPGLDHALRQAELAVIAVRRAKRGSESPILHQKIKDGTRHPLFFDETSTIRTPSSPAMPGLDHALRQAELAVITGRRAKPGSKSPMLHQKIKDGICHPLFFDETSTIRTPSSPAKPGLDHALRQAELAVIAVRRAKRGSDFFCHCQNKMVYLSFFV